MRKKLILTAFLVTPIVALVVILLVIKYSRPAMNAPPVGAGAGDTGGANAIGEYIAHGSSRPIVPGAKPPAEAPTEPAPPVEAPKPVTTPIEPARTVYPRGTLNTLKIPAAGNQPEATVQVLTPPGYDGNAGLTYPVLYLIGDKIFDPTGLAADDTVAELVAKSNMDRAIIVALPPSDAATNSQRLEYAKWLATAGASSVMAKYRVRAWPETTGVGGVGPDAWTALAAITHQGKNFGILLVQDPSQPTSPLEEFQPPKRVFLGSASSSSAASAVKELQSNLKGAGMGPDRLLVLTDDATPDAATASRRRLQHALAFLYPPDVDPTK